MCVLKKFSQKRTTHGLTQPLCFCGRSSNFCNATGRRVALTRTYTGMPLSCAHFEWSESCEPPLPGATRGRLFYRDRGRTSNCIATLDVARFVAELLERRLVVSPCFATQTFYVQPGRRGPGGGTEDREPWQPDPWDVYTADTLSTCQRKPGRASLELRAMPFRQALPNKAALVASRARVAARPVTCVNFFQGVPPCQGRWAPADTGSRPAACGNVTLEDWCRTHERNPCCSVQLAHEFPGLRVERIVSVLIPGRFMYEWLSWNATHSAQVGWRPTHPLVGASTPWVQKLLAIGGDVLVPNMLSLLYKIRQAPMFGLCRQPQLGPTMVDFTHRLEAALVGHGLQRPYACMHWRVEDMLCGLREPCPIGGDFAFSDPSMAADLVTKVLARHRPRVRSLLVLTQPSNLMLGAFAAALANRSELEDGTRGRGRRPFVVIAPARVYAADAQAYPEHVVSFEATFAEKALCAQAAYFFGDQRSSFSAHISAMGRAAAEDAGGVPWLERLAKSGQCYMPDVWDGVGKYCYA